MPYTADQGSATENERVAGGVTSPPDNSRTMPRLKKSGLSESASRLATNLKGEGGRRYDELARSLPRRRTRTISAHRDVSDHPVYDCAWRPHTAANAALLTTGPGTYASSVETSEQPISVEDVHFEGPSYTSDDTATWHRSA